MSLRKKRGYDRDVLVPLVRDYKLFAIACEGGVREPEYFNVFRHLSTRVAVDVVEEVVNDEEMESTNVHKSAPRWVLDRAIKYIEKDGLSQEDELWFILDKDKWTFDQLKEISEYCDDKPNWFIAISNPCFEVWLYFHKHADIEKSDSVSCDDFKREISTFAVGGYNPLKFVRFTPSAIENARNADTDPNHFMPSVKQTKMYKPVQGIMEFAGINQFQEFLDEKLPKLIATELEKARLHKKMKKEALIPKGKKDKKK